MDSDYITGSESDASDCIMPYGEEDVNSPPLLQLLRYFLLYWVQTVWYIGTPTLPTC